MPKPIKQSIVAPPTDDMLLALTNCVRCFTREQIRDSYFEGRRNAANWRIGQCVANGLLVAKQVLVRELPTPAGPIFTWSAGQASLPVQKLVSLTRARWETVETKQLTIYLRGPLAAKLFGGKYKGKLIRSLQASHDLGLSGSYLTVRRDRPQIAKGWLGEDVAPKQRGAIPDAVYVDGRGTIRTAFEFCGLYSAKRLQAFHRHCANRGLSYELW